ncbi:MAG: hypothetical protein HOB02_05595 [Proteobacteria bacterium]|nr:hypothetical protein [Pseudomonadota bacterium]MBT7427416.1 hypothetical protein [Betaproteobacteria bacterium]
MYDIELKLNRAASIKYAGSDSPKLIKSVSGEYAEIMVESAKEIGVPVVRSPGLVEALSALPEDSEVPEELFEMVAVVLSWAYWIKSKTPEEGPYD